MKVLALYSGEPRSFDKIHNQHLDFFDGLDVETFHCTWNHSTEEDFTKIKLAHNIKYIGSVDYNIPERADIRRFEKLLLMHTQNHPIFMLGRIQYMTGSALGRDSAIIFKYDLAVRMRYDFTYEGKLKDYIPKNINDNDVFITRKMGGKSHPNNVWDGFAFGRPYAMSFYFDFNKWIPFSLFNNEVRNWKFQPEFVYGTYLRHVGLNVIDSQVQPTHYYPDNHDVNWHREMRTVQYYRDLARFHPEFYKTKNHKLIILNDSPWVSDLHIIQKLKEEGIQCNEIQ